MQPWALDVIPLGFEERFNLSTISSFGLHTDYHRTTDDISKIDFPFMTRSLNSLVAPIRWLANSNFRPAWLPGKAPAR